MQQQRRQQQSQFDCKKMKSDTVQALMNESKKNPQLALHCAKYFHSLSQFCLEYARREHQHATNKNKFIRKKPGMQRNKGKDAAVANDPPKKPLTAYIMYFQEKKGDFIRRFPDLNLSDVTKLIAKEWKELSQGERQRYLDKASEDRKRFDEKLADFKKEFHRVCEEEGLLQDAIQDNVEKRNNSDSERQ